MKSAILHSLGPIDKFTIFFIQNHDEIFYAGIIAHLFIIGHKNSFIEVAIFLFFTTSSPFSKSCLFLPLVLLRNSRL